MRVLLLDQFSDPGGAQQCLLELLPAMHERGWDVMAGLPGDGELIGRFDALRVPTGTITCGPYSSSRKTMTDAARYLLEGPRLIRQIERMAAQFRPDVLYVNGPRLLPATALADTQTPVVFHSHSYIPSHGARRLAGASLRRAAARVIACCEFVAQPWRKFRGTRPRQGDLQRRGRTARDSSRRHAGEGIGHRLHRKDRPGKGPAGIHQGRRTHPPGRS